VESIPVVVGLRNNGLFVERPGCQLETEVEGMTRTPDETKKGLECCAASYADCHRECPYKPDCDGSQILKDSLALIQQLQAENAEKTETIMWMEAERDDLKRTIRKLEDHLREATKKVEQLEAERDAAVADIKQMVLDPYEPCFCDYCKLTEEECARSNCKGRSAFVWRGVQKEDGDA
jgi:hypothetical protein